MAERYVKICPQCGSTKVSADMSTSTAIATGVFCNQYSCDSCGNTGTFFPEVKESDVGYYQQERNKND